VADDEELPMGEANRERVFIALKPMRETFLWLVSLHLAQPDTP